MPQVDVLFYAQLAGSIGGVLSVTSFLPQLMRIYRRRSADDISLAMYVGIVLGAFLWMFYAYVLDAPALFFTNLVIAAIATAIAAMKLRYGKRP